MTSTAATTKTLLTTGMTHGTKVHFLRLAKTRDGKRWLPVCSSQMQHLYGQPDATPGEVTCKRCQGKNYTPVAVTGSHHEGWVAVQNLTTVVELVTEQERFLAVMGC